MNADRDLNARRGEMARDHTASSRWLVRADAERDGRKRNAREGIPCAQIRIRSAQSEGTRRSADM